MGEPAINGLKTQTIAEIDCKWLNANEKMLIPTEVSGKCAF